MNNYEENTFTDYDKIIIDTSAAMHYWALKKFISDSESCLLHANKKVFVPKVVWMELVRAYNSRNKEKVEGIKYIEVPEDKKTDSTLLTIGKYALAILSGILIGACGKEVIDCSKKNGGICHG